MAFSDEELDRYARHIILREVGGPGQQRLKAAKVLVVGAGGLGAPALLYLAAAGVGRIGIVDDDVVDLSNLQRQVIHGVADIGTQKTDSAATAIAAINPNVEVVPHTLRLSPANVDSIVNQYDLILDGTDNFDTRYAINAACVGAEKPLVAAAIAQWEGQISLYHPANGAPCYACVFPQAPADGLAPSCAEAGVLGALAGVIGSMMAVEAVKHITGAGQTLAGKMALYDALWGENRTLTIDRNPACPVCGEQRHAVQSGEM